MTNKTETNYKHISNFTMYTSKVSYLNSFLMDSEGLKILRREYLVHDISKTFTLSVNPENYIWLSEWFLQVGWKTKVWVINLPSSPPKVRLFTSVCVWVNNHHVSVSERKISSVKIAFIFHILITDRPTWGLRFKRIILHLEVCSRIIGLFVKRVWAQFLIDYYWLGVCR